MTIRSLTLVALVTVLGSSSGCSGMKNFLFGRGASCGLCNRARAIGTAINPLAAAPAPRPMGAPPAPGCRIPRCGLFGRNQTPTHAPPAACAPAPTCAPSYGPSYGGGQGGYAGPSYANGDCVSEGYSAAMPGDCGCGTSCGGNCGAYNGGVMYDRGVVDPYLGSGATNGGYQGGEVIQGDGFQARSYGARRFDDQGDQIISEDPMPAGIEYLK